MVYADIGPSPGEQDLECETLPDEYAKIKPLDSTLNTVPGISYY